MLPTNLQDLCERGQVELMETRYLEAAKTFETAEAQAWRIQDFDTLSRLYLPFQEARRQIRQRCGEGTVKLHLLAGPDGKIDSLAPADISQGQLLIAGWGTIKPACQMRKLAAEKKLYIETFLAAVFPTTDIAQVVILVPTASADLPAEEPRPFAELQTLLPANCLTLKPSEIPPDAEVGSAQSFAGVMNLWERLHTPFLNDAANEPDPIRRMEAYRLTLRVDPACELAHQFLADIARKLARGK